MRALALTLLVSCVPAYRVATRRDPPLAVYLVDFAAMGVALAAAVDGYTRGVSVQLGLGLGAWAGLTGAQAVNAP